MDDPHKSAKIIASSILAASGAIVMYMPAPRPHYNDIPIGLLLLVLGLALMEEVWLGWGRKAAKRFWQEILEERAAYAGSEFPPDREAAAPEDLSPDPGQTAD